MAEILLAVNKYNEELVKDIQEVFIHRIVPDNFILVIHKYNTNVLTLEDIERIQKTISFKSTKEVNYNLLLTMKKYKGWFEVILQVCNDPDVRQADLAEAFQAIKGELDERRAKQHTKSKDIATTPANVSLTSESNLGATTMGRQLSANGGLEADSGAVCMSSESKYQEEKNSYELTTEDQHVTTDQSSWKGFKLKNGKPYCDICCLGLTSQKAANDHFTGKQHQKELKKKSLVSEDVSRTDITTAAISQSTYDDAKSPSSESNSGSGEPAALSPGPISDYKITPESLKPMSCNDDAIAKELLTESQSVTANNAYWGGLKIKNENLYCDICDAILTSKVVADDHCKGKTHKKNLNKAFPISKERTPTNSEVTEATPVSTCPGVFEATPVSTCPGVFEATSQSSRATKATPTSSGAAEATAISSGATEATVVSADSKYGFAAASKQASGSDEEYIIVNDKGQLECRICKVPVSGGESAIQHLQGSKHKKALKAPDNHDEALPELGPQGETLIMFENGAGKCFVCKIPINSRDSARQHIEGRQHINRCKKYNLPVK